MPELKRPFLRQVLTVVPVWDPGSDVTIELLIIPEEQDLTPDELPELNQAGWTQTTMKGLEVFIRLVG